MPPHVLPDLKRNEPAVTPAALRPAGVLLGPGGSSPPHTTASGPEPSVEAIGRNGDICF